MQATCHPALIGHAGLGIHRTGGAPTRETLTLALRLGLDAVEVDVCTTLDRALVLHHDHRLASGVPLAALTLAQLRHADPELLTLSEAAELLGRDVRLVIDVKSHIAVPPLGRWLHHHSRRRRLVVCTERVASLRDLAAAAPRVDVWQTFPDIGTRAHERVLRVLMGLLAHRRSHALRLAGDLWGGLLRVQLQPRQALAHLSGLPWRALLPELLEPVRQQVRASGITVHHALVTPELCAAARRSGLEVIAWTVNRAQIARRVAHCGVDLITTDDVTGVRRALGSGR